MDPLFTPLLAGFARHALTTLGGTLVASGVIQSSQVDSFVGASMVLLGIGWSYWNKRGQAQATALLKKLTATSTHADAVATAKLLPPADPAKVQSAVINASRVASLVLFAFAVSLFLAVGSPAHAQAKKGFAITGNPIADIKSDIATATGNTVSGAANNIADTLAKPFQDIAKFVGEDADGAIALSTQIAALQDGHGQQCWMAMKAYGDIVKAHPVPLTFHVINDFEALRLLAMATNNLCSNVHCTQVFADATSMAQAASPVPLAIPSLHDLCSKVPQIPVVAPVTPAASSTATPAAK